MIPKLRDREASAAFYNERYAHGYMDDWSAAKKERVREVIRELHLPDVGQALDFGCGTGVFTEEIRQALPRWTIHGTDFSPVAVARASARFPQCTFFTISQQDLRDTRFDFVFTHHVLEHVYDLESVWRELVAFMKPGATSLHILPCGNEGSLEYEICRLRTDGVNPQMEGRFFFEDDGHLRRLTTNQLTALAARSRLTLIKAYYANQRAGAVAWITGSGQGFVRMLTDSRTANDAVARANLVVLRRRLLVLTWARELVSGVEARWASREKTTVTWIGLFRRLPLYPVCWLIAWLVKHYAAREWASRKHDPSGSEMYLAFRRP